MKKRYWIKGAITLNALFALVIISQCFLLLVDTLKVLSKTTELDYTVGNMKDIYLLQMKLCYSTDFSSNGKELYFNYKGRNFTLKQIDNHLVLTPGAQYFALDVSDVSFYNDNSVWYMHIELDGNPYTIGLVYED